MNALLALSIGEWIVIVILIVGVLSVFTAANIAIRRKKKAHAPGSGDGGIGPAVLGSSDCDSSDSGDCGGGDGGGD